MKDYIELNKARWNNAAGEKGNPYTVPTDHDEITEAERKPIAGSLTVGETVPAE